jgi:hypothetical protein
VYLPAVGAESARLDQFIAAAKSLHEAIERIHSKATAEEQRLALGHGFEAGEALFQARGVHKYLQKIGETKGGWIALVEAAFDFSYATVCTYIRLYENRERLLRDLPTENRSIRGAIRFLGPTKKRTRKRREVLIERSEFIALAEQHGIADVVNEPECGRAFFNAVAAKAGFPKDIAFGKLKVGVSLQGDKSRAL